MHNTHTHAHTLTPPSQWKQQKGEWQLKKGKKTTHDQLYKCHEEVWLPTHSLTKYQTNQTKEYAIWCILMQILAQNN